MVKWEKYTQRVPNIQTSKVPVCSVADPDPFYTVPDPTFHFNTDPDPAF